MQDLKLWYQSKTIWGALVAVASSLLGLAGVHLGLDEQGDLADLLVGLGGSLGGLLALYGRISAKTGIVQRSRSE
ncbi:hypothetical protein HGO38_29690 [Rhizobium sp. CG5]|uniref:hypothetical protein n=1 Tax=Rhizobium sp. CG5 TaxID=2726076 RepID=UPI002033AFF1|nr:hypothetical protein [Rhizobium sp. CG5]MCM2477624.1 hypothetical protein [Rhizobium sp. CG5]